MVEEQLVRRGVTDARVLDAMRRIPRHRFVEEALRDRAYGDHPLPIGESQTISQPYIVGLMTQLLALDGLGEGAGDRHRLRATRRRCWPSWRARVCSVERLHVAWPRERGGSWRSWGILAQSVETADGTLGWPDEAPFDRILVTAGAPAVPPPLFQQLAEGGRMVVPVGGPPVAGAARRREGRRPRCGCRRDCGCTFVKLVGKYGWET